MLKKSVSSEVLSKQFKPYWDAVLEAVQTNNPKPDFVVFLVKLYVWKIMAIFVASVIKAGLSIYLVQLFVDQAVGIFNASPNLPLPLENGYTVGLILFLIQIAIAVCQSYISNAQRRLTLIFTSILSSAVIEKRLRISPESTLSFSDGKVMHLATSDCKGISEVLPSILTYLIVIGEICLTCSLLSSRLGVSSAVASLSIAFLSAAATLGSGPSFNRNYSKGIEKNDQRITKTREALIGKLSILPGRISGFEVQSLGIYC